MTKVPRAGDRRCYYAVVKKLTKKGNDKMNVYVFPPVEGLYPHKVKEVLTWGCKPIIQRSEPAPE